MHRNAEFQLANAKRRTSLWADSAALGVCACTYQAFLASNGHVSWTNCSLASTPHLEFQLPTNSKPQTNVERRSTNRVCGRDLHGL